MTEHYSSFSEAAGAAMAHNARMAAGHNIERAAEDQPAPAPRNALSAPQVAEHPTPGPERHPGGENGPHTGTQRAAGVDRPRPARHALHLALRTGITRAAADQLIDAAIAEDHATTPAGGDRAELCRLFKDAITRRWDVGPFVIDEIVDDAVDCHLSRVREYENAIKEQRDALVAQITAIRAVTDAIDTEMRTEPDTQRSAMQMETVTRIRAALNAPQAGDDTTGDTP